MTEKKIAAKRASALMLAGAGLALATAGCMTADPYGDPYADGPYDQGPYGGGPYGEPGDYGANPYPGTDDNPAPYQGAPAVAPRRIGGTIETRDFPRSGAQQRDGRSGLYEMDIGADGRVTGCRASEPSGLPDLDAFMCRLISERFVYEPARDASGRAVPGVAGWRQDWYLPGR